MNKTILIIIAITAVLIAAGIYQSYQIATAPKSQDKPVATMPPDEGGKTGNEEAKPAETGDAGKIDTFEGCAAAGYPVTGEKPKRQCKFSDSLTYLEIETCRTPTGESMAFNEAQVVFASSQCGLEGSPESHYCNENTGTWWIDILTYRKGCDPACVIDVKTKKAEINWRCDGNVASPQN